MKIKDFAVLSKFSDRQLKIVIPLYSPGSIGGEPFVEITNVKFGKRNMLPFTNNERGSPIIFKASHGV
ncbi:hypothetical protein P5704_024655 (plasmid) [Pseudomonas sp. FeN3W]|nr:hypothetical protein P5704_024655 [Pseudomonas sp. FeN3W]